MKKVAIAVLSALTLPATCFAADIMRDGFWELSTTVEIPGMPFQVPPTRTQHCYTKEEVKDTSKTLNTDPNCKVTDMKRSGNRITWRMQCTGEKSGTFSGETVFKGDAYDSKMKMESEGQTVNMKVKGQRIGPCS